MAFIGQKSVGTSLTSRTLDSFTSTGQTTFTISQTLDSANNISVYFDGVMQRPTTDYTLSGNVITFVEAVPVGVFVIMLAGGGEVIGSPFTESVETEHLQDSVVTNAKLATGIDASKITGSALPALDASNLAGDSIFYKNASDPAIDTNTIDGTAVVVGQLWTNTTTGEMFICTDATTDANVWVNVGGGVGDVYTYQGKVAGIVSLDTGAIYSVSFTSDGTTSSVGTFAKGTDAGGHATTQSKTHGYSAGGATAGSPPYNGEIDKFQFAASITSSTIASTLSQIILTPEGASSLTDGYAVGGVTAFAAFAINTKLCQKFSYASEGPSDNTQELQRAMRNGGCWSTVTDGYYVSGSIDTTNGGSVATNTDNIEKFSFSSNANATLLVDTLTAANHVFATLQSDSDGYTAAGHNGGSQQLVQKYSFASGGNATNIGNLSQSRYNPGGCSSITHGYVISGAGVSPASTRLDKFAFASGNSISNLGDVTSFSGAAMGNGWQY